MKVGLAQINTTIGDYAGNEAKILEGYRRGVALGAGLVVFPELAVNGYPPRDLLLRASFVREGWACVERMAAATGDAGLVVGYVAPRSERPGRPCANAAALLHRGRVVAVRHKTLLPTYDVFDEDRYFEPGSENAPIEFRGLHLGVTVCEDIWNDEDFWHERRYRSNPPLELVGRGVRCLLNLSASPWHVGKNRTRIGMLSSLAQKAGVPVLYCNLVGGNDELIFDGGSVAFDAAGRCVAQARVFDEDVVVVDLEAPGGPAIEAAGCDEEMLYSALVLGVRDYLHKCGFRSAVLGLSGGIDSAVTACVAAAALGAENVRGVSMPSQFSSRGSMDDARALASNLGIRYDVIGIEAAFESLKGSLRPLFEGRAEDTTEENIQARLRGLLLMALSNKWGALLLTTGNKSELAVGYCTLYGDMCGGLAVISDVPKTWIYRLAHWINREREIIPAASITKAPSAELRPNQTDQDSLPPYEVLDAILEAYVVEGLPVEAILAAGWDEATVRRVVRMIDVAEYKRRQAAPGLKVTSKAFGMGRRIPIAQRFREG
jgi:NAD+ synthetase